MYYRIVEKKLLFVNCLKLLPDSCLAKEIFNEQLVQGYPGLIREVKDICEKMGLPDISVQDIPKGQWKKIVRERCVKKYEEWSREKMEGLKKCEKIMHDPFGRKNYLENKSIPDSRMIFRIRTNMVELKANQKSNKKYKEEGWECDFCDEKSEETTTHVINCKGHEELRKGKDFENDNDLAEYFRQVLKARCEKGEKRGEKNKKKEVIK